MKDVENEFLEAMGEIQRVAVNIMLCNLEKYSRIEDVLNDITYDVIYRIMELIDGYNEKGLQLDIIDKNTLNIIGNNRELHDMCVEYLKSTDL